MEKLDTASFLGTLQAVPDCTGLTITRKQFIELYPDLKDYYDFYNSPPPLGLSTEYFEKFYLKSKLWRLNNIYSVIDKHANKVKFKMKLSQHKVYAASRIHPRVICLKSRQQGISTFYLISFGDDAIWSPNIEIGLMAQGQREAKSLLKRLKYMWDNLNNDIKAYAKVKLVKNNDIEFSFSNKSTILVSVSFRSATLHRLHISEYGKIANANPKRAEETKTGTLQAISPKNTAIIESTAEGRNDFKFTWDNSILALHSGQMAPKDFYPVFLPWIFDPDCNADVKQEIDKEAQDYFTKLEEDSGHTLTDSQKNFWIIQRRELAGNVYQEYPGTPEEAFKAAKDGTYYNRLFNETVVRKGKVKTNLYDPNIPIDVYWDLGVEDYCVQTYVQWYRGEWRIVDEYYDQNYANTYYMDEAHSRGYNIRSHWFPHDVKVREQSVAYTNGLAKTRYDIIQEHCIKEKYEAALHVLPKSSIINGVEAVRRMIPRLAIDAKCEYIISCLTNYSKEYDDKLRVWKKTPLHDVYSHGADNLRYIAGSTIESEFYNASWMAGDDDYTDDYSTDLGGGFSI